MRFVSRPLLARVTRVKSISSVLFIGFLPPCWRFVGNIFHLFPPAAESISFKHLVYVQAIISRDHQLPPGSDQSCEWSVKRLVLGVYGQDPGHPSTYPHDPNTCIDRRTPVGIFSLTSGHSILGTCPQVCPIDSSQRTLI